VAMVREHGETQSQEEQEGEFDFGTLVHDKDKESKRDTYSYERRGSWVPNCCATVTALQQLCLLQVRLWLNLFFLLWLQMQQLCSIVRSVE
jgi:hypothetical protein